MTVCVLFQSWYVSIYISIVALVLGISRGPGRAPGRRWPLGLFSVTVAELGRIVATVAAFRQPWPLGLG